MVGYPKGMAQKNERNSCFWSYGAIIGRLIDAGKEYGIKHVNKRNTSKRCSLCGGIYESGRKPASYIYVLV